MENLKVINKSSLLKNISCFGGKEICAMVKCNAYGHGLEQIVQAAEENVASFGVVSAFEGKQVRKFTNKPVIVFSANENLALCKKYNLQFIVESESEIKNAIRLGIQDAMHLKIDCGMNRFGLKSKIALCQIDNILQSENIKLNSICTHFPVTENRRETLKNYRQFVELKKNISQNAPICFGGSGVFDYNFDYQILRLGLGMYGYGHKNLQSVVKIFSYVKKVFFARRGENIGYGMGYTVQKDGFFAVVAMGYGDGLRRNLSGKFCVKINGKKIAAVGNICMDCFFVEADKNVKVGDVVEVLWNADKFAKICGTIPYEFLTGLSNFRAKTILK